MMTLLVAAMAVSMTTATAADSPVTEPLGDKTLVVWAAPSNLTQRGGSVLSVDDLHENFDGIVFGERKSATWMAGSEFYRRTAADQSAWAAETAGPDEFVQVAIVWKGQDVTLYRNGEVLATYSMESSRTFSTNRVFLIGKRHLMPALTDESFAGRIDDARVYTSALTADEICGLKANQASETTPLAWWDFENGVADRMGGYGDIILTGGATIQDGKLVLPGNGASMLATATGTLTSSLFPIARQFASPSVPEHPAMPAVPPDSWPVFHLLHPGPGGAMPGDPNCSFWIDDVCHLHYIYNHRNGFAFSHVSSRDMVHWKWHPTVLEPKMTGHGMFSGTGFITKDGTPAIIYHGEGSGRNQLAFALDDTLNRWSQPMAINPLTTDGKEPEMRHWDPDCWIRDGVYYALSGGQNPTLIRSPDLKEWTYIGPLLSDGYSEELLGVPKDEDISCANMFRIGDKWMLLCISHTLGCRYYLGDFDGEQYLPEYHAMMSWNGNHYFAPESVLTGDGRRIMWAWLLNLPVAPCGVQSLPRELELPEDGVLRIRPLRELESLRGETKQESVTDIAADTVVPLKTIHGNVLEMAVTFRPSGAGSFGLDVLCDANGENGTRIEYHPEAGTLSVGITNAPLKLAKGEELSLRIFVDKNLVEVFANDRQAALAANPYVRENTHIQLFSNDALTALKDGVTAWKVRSA